MSASTEQHERPRAKAFVPALIVGWLIIGFGIHSALHNDKDADPFALLVHVVSFDLGHDLVLAPVVLIVGWLSAKLVPTVARGPVRAALATTSMFVVFSVPLVRRWGRRPTNSSTLPLAYGRNLTIVVGIVWAIAAVVVVQRTVAARTARGGHGDGPVAQPAVTAEGSGNAA